MQSIISARLGLDDADPLTLAMQPSPDETPEEKAERLALEQHKKEVSDNIDAELEREQILQKRNPKPVKILLLGKSTTLKNFQLMYAPEDFRKERLSWRAVIQLNVVQSIRVILDFISRAEEESSSPVSPTSPHRTAALLNADILAIKNNLQPNIVAAESTLIRRLTSGGSASNGGPTRPTGMISDHKGTLKEIAINSAVNWKRAFKRNKGEKTGGGEGCDTADEDAIEWEDDPEDPWLLLQGHVQDMIALWSSPNVKKLMGKQSGRIEDISGYFLDSLERIIQPRYIPTDDDILHARLKTLGMFFPDDPYDMSWGTGTVTREWKVYDVGGHRSQVAAWAPYFDDMDAIIFLAPLSCFDQVLEEDHKVNRLEDSYKLWSMLASNPLLKHTNLILFMNKIDMLKNKLESGVRLKDYVISYGDRPNDVENTTAYLKRKFAAILSEKSPLPRVFYPHFTTVTDRHSTKAILANISDSLMRQNLLKTNLLA
ncbi:G-alpha-domain-containing protein [Agrocybe pediades]|nr:G-alpha-domain-containing protein [Agrocybe pediades]